jgi:hypothetical protein
LRLASAPRAYLLALATMVQRQACVAVLMMLLPEAV